MIGVKTLQSGNQDERMICKIYGTKETDNPDGICDECKFCVIDNKNLSSMK